MYTGLGRSAFGKSVLERHRHLYSFIVGSVQSAILGYICWNRLLFEIYIYSAGFWTQAIKDKNLLSAGGSSDPFVTLEIQGASSCKCQSTVRPSTLEPKWREVFALECEDPSATLLCTVWDHDSLTASDFAGQFTVLVAPLTDQKVVMNWHTLEKGTGKHTSDNVSGELELVLHFWYNHELDCDPFPEPDEFPDKDPNELRVFLARGRNLAVADKNLLSKGSQRPTTVY